MGFFNLLEASKKNKVKNSDVYDLASITKIGATIPALMKLVDENLISVDSTLGAYLNLEG